MSSAPVKCVYCQSDNISAGYFEEVDDCEASRKVTCKSCDRWWWEVYVFSQAEHENGSVIEPHEYNTPEETLVMFDKLKPILETFEHITYKDTGYFRLSGGFAVADYDCHDDQWVFITLKYGVQNDVENRVYTEKYKIPLEIVNDESISTQKKSTYMEDA